jgi:hypothetical protein
VIPVLIALTSAFTCMTACLSLIGVIMTRRNAAKIERNAVKIDANAKVVQETHVLVNQRMTDKLNRIEQLVDSMRANDVAIPTDPAEPPYHQIEGKLRDV